jgi:hypothetical protein
MVLSGRASLRNTKIGVPVDTPERVVPPPYFAFKTLTNMIISMEEHGPPNRVDRSFLKGMSGAGQTQFIAGLKSLGLIGENGEVQPKLVELVNNADERPARIGQVLRERYPEAVELGKGNATTGELVEAFAGYGVRGDTARKAIAFYLQAAKYAGDVPLSPNFRTPPNQSSGVGKARKPRSRDAEQEPQRGVSSDLPAGLHPALSGLLSDIPKRGQTWTQAQYDDFMAAFKAVIKIAAPVSDAQADDHDDFDIEEDE